VSTLARLLASALTVITERNALVSRSDSKDGQHDTDSVTRACESTSPSCHTPESSPRHTTPPNDNVQAEPPIDPVLIAQPDAEDRLATAVFPLPADNSQWPRINAHRSDITLDQTLPTIPWRLQTVLSTNDPESQPPTSSASPITPGLGIEGLYHGQGYDMSRESSVTDLSSYVGATRGMGSTTAESSESGYEVGGYGTEGGQDEQAGVPPPKPKKSHARRVSRQVSY
jgi:hypothetical protein